MPEHRCDLQRCRAATFASDVNAFQVFSSLVVGVRSLLQQEGDAADVAVARCSIKRKLALEPVRGDNIGASMEADDAQAIRVAACCGVVRWRRAIWVLQERERRVLLLRETAAGVGAKYEQAGGL